MNKTIARQDAVNCLCQHMGKDLSRYAEDFSINIMVNGKQNKGWKG